MPKINPFTLSAPAKPQPEIGTFTDARHPGQEFSITLVASSGLLEDLATDEKVREYTAYYMEEKGGQVLMNDGTKLGVTANLLSLIANLERAEVCAEGEAPYSLLDWLMLAHRAPDAFTEMVAFQDRLQEKERERLCPKAAEDAPRPEDLLLGEPPVFPMPAGGA